LNNASHGTTKELLEAVHADVESFVGKAPQFDDLTMMAIKHT
jgi:serine phosphatase RsbU (regulator of sigma subunit)